MPSPRPAPSNEVIYKRSGKKIHGLFVDGVTLDRIAKKNNKKISFDGLIASVCAGSEPIVARYYTIIPHEDDSRHHSFLDAVRASGFTVVVKRLPPKGVNRHISIDNEIAVDIVTFGLGFSQFPDSHDFHRDSTFMGTERISRKERLKNELTASLEGLSKDTPLSRSVTVVCPSRDLTYSMELLKGYGIETISADFGKYQSGDLLKAAAQFIDLSDADTLWRI